MRKLLLLVVLLSGASFAQTVTDATLETVQTFTGAKTFNILSYTGVWRDCRVDGVKADGTTNDGPAINTCIANAVAQGYGGIILPTGGLHIQTALNFTNRRGLRVMGSGTEVYSHAANANITELLCDTGTVCMDTAGSTSMEFRNFAMRLANSYATPSTVAVIEGRTASNGGTCYSENNRWERVNIWTDFNGGSFNGGQGYIGFYNVGGEARKYDSIYILANTPMVFATTNVYSVTSPYETLGTSCPQSMTVVQMDQMTLSNNGGNAITAWTTADFTLHDVVVLGTAANAALFNSAFVFNGTYNTNWNVTAHVESLQDQNSVMSIGSTTFDKNKFTVNVGGSVASAFPYVAFAGSGQTIQDNYIAFDTHNEAGNQRLFISNAAPETVKGGEFWIGGSQSPLARSNITLTGTVVHAEGFTSGNVSFATGSTYTLYSDSGISLRGIESIRSPNLLLSSTAPTISTHFNTSSDSISANNGTAAFTVTVGTGTGTTTGVIGLPTATTGWHCMADNLTRAARIQQTATSTTSATITNMAATVATPTNWSNSDVLAVSCFAY